MDIKEFIEYFAGELDETKIIYKFIDAPSM